MTVHNHLNVSTSLLIIILGGKGLLLPVNCYALELDLEQGSTAQYFSGGYTSGNYNAFSLRYGYFELVQGGWYGQTRGRFTSLGASIRSSGPWFAEAGLGLAYVETTSKQLDGHGQFLTTLGVGRRIDNLTVSVKFRHLSNADTQGRNLGMDFELLSIGAAF
jgi:hypothetical protein